MRSAGPEVHSALNDVPNTKTETQTKLPIERIAQPHFQCSGECSDRPVRATSRPSIKPCSWHNTVGSDCAIVGAAASARPTKTHRIDIDLPKIKLPLRSVEKQTSVTTQKPHAVCWLWSYKPRLTPHRPNCQRRSKNRPKGGAKVDHFGVGRDGHADRRRPVSRAPAIFAPVWQPELRFGRICAG